MATSILDKVKKSLRISNNAFDEAEIKPLIEAAKKELRLAGADKLRIDDPLVVRAIVVYCKANFGYDNTDSAKLIDSFNSLKNMISQSGDYISRKGII